MQLKTVKKICTLTIVQQHPLVNIAPTISAMQFLLRSPTSSQYHLFDENTDWQSGWMRKIWMTRADWKSTLLNLQIFSFSTAKVAFYQSVLNGIWQGWDSQEPFLSFYEGDEVFVKDGGSIFTCLHWKTAMNVLIINLVFEQYTWTYERLHWRREFFLRNHGSFGICIYPGVCPFAGIIRGEIKVRGSWCQAKLLRCSYRAQPSLYFAKKIWRHMIQAVCPDRISCIVSIGALRRCE